eukprot:10442_1
MSFHDALASFLCVYLVTVDSKWLLLLNQDTTAPDGLFSLEARSNFLSNTDDPTSNTFSIAGIPSFPDFLNNERYQFRLIYDDGQWERIWTQTSWLTSATITGSSIADRGFNGLGLCHSPAGTQFLGAMFDGTGIGSYWYYAVGLTTTGTYYNGLPVYSGYTATKVKLYVCMADVCDTDSEMVECPLDSNADLECTEDICNIKTFDWDKMTGTHENAPIVEDFVFNVDSTDLTLNIYVELPYLGKTSANNQREANFG